MALENAKMIAEWTIEDIKNCAIDDPEKAAHLELMLYRTFVSSISKGPNDELAKFARIILKAKDIKFPR